MTERGRDVLAHGLALAVFLASAGICVWLFVSLTLPWSLIAPLAVFAAGSIAAERLFRRFVTPEGLRREMAERVEASDL